MRRRLQLYLPKFSIEGAYQLEKVLPRLGIRELFTSQADLTGLTNHSNVQVSEVSAGAIAASLRPALPLPTSHGAGFVH